MMEISMGSEFALERSIFQLPDHQHCFSYDRFTHLTRPGMAVDKDDRDLLDLESLSPGTEVHFDLEGITVGADIVEIDRLEHSTAKTLKTTCRVLHLDAGDQTRVLVGIGGKHQPAFGPVLDIRSRDVARTKYEIVCQDLV